MKNKQYFLKSKIDFEKEPYNEDLLDNRRIFGDRLKEFLNTVGDGCVFAIDAPWGDGKSTFIKWWHADITQEYSSVILNVFEHDFQGDAFSAIFPILNKMFESNKTQWKNFTEDIQEVLTTSFEQLMKKGLPLLAGSLAAFVSGNIVLGAVAGGVTKEVTGSILSEEHPKTRHQELEEFKVSLNEFSTTVFENTGKPFVFIIDELDRCRPTFAVEILEKIKHFFAVPGIVWVVAVNIEQLSESIEHIYGTRKPELYLEKFFNFTTALPRDTRDKLHYQKLVAKNLRKALRNDGGLYEKLFVELIWHYKVSLRDFEKIEVYINVLGNFRDIIALFLVILKIREPLLYAEIRTRGFSNGLIEEHFSYLLSLDDSTHANLLYGSIHFAQYESEASAQEEARKMSDNVDHYALIPRKKEALKSYIDKVKSDENCYSQFNPTNYKRYCESIDFFRS